MTELTALEAITRVKPSGCKSPSYASSPEHSSLTAGIGDERRPAHLSTVGTTRDRATGAGR